MRCRSSNRDFTTKTPLKQNQFGFVVGGPVLLPKIYDGRNHTFWLVSYNGGRRATGSYGVTQMPRRRKAGRLRHVADAAIRSADQRVTPGGSVPVSRTPFAGNQIPLSRSRPERQSHQVWQTPNVPCQTPCNN